MRAVQGDRRPRGVAHGGPAHPGERGRRRGGAGAPGVFVGTLAYQFSRTPPKSLKPRPNVAIQLCSIEACQIHPLDDPTCPKNVDFRKDLEGWSKISGHVYVWNYNTNFACYNAPCPNLDVIGPNVRFLAAHGVSGVFMQAPGNAHNTELCELRNYLISRLLWDPTIDDRKTIDEFVTLYYGQAADKVRAYLTLIGEAARRSGVHQGCFGSAAPTGSTPPWRGRRSRSWRKAWRRPRTTRSGGGWRRPRSPRDTVLIDPFAKWVRGHNHQLAAGEIAKAPAEAYTGIEAASSATSSGFTRSTRSTGSPSGSRWTR